MRENGSAATVKYDNLRDRLAVFTAEGRAMLPEDLYSKFDNNGGKQSQPRVQRTRRLNQASYLAIPQLVFLLQALKLSSQWLLTLHLYDRGRLGSH